MFPPPDLLAAKRYTLLHIILLINDILYLNAYKQTTPYKGLSDCWVALKNTTRLELSGLIQALYCSWYANNPTFQRITIFKITLYSYLTSEDPSG